VRDGGSDAGRPRSQRQHPRLVAATKNYTYHHYDQNGRSRSETCFANELQGLTCLGERRTDAGLVQSRSHIWPVQGGAAFRNERSVNGGAWSETVRLKYIPRAGR
jgi:hypothetical protein